MTLIEQLRSQLNNLFWQSRRFLRFRRAGYKEALEQPAAFTPEPARLDAQYKFSLVREKLSAFNGARNLASIWYLEKMLSGITWPEKINVLEPGCQDFSRLPAWRAFFKKNKVDAHFTGIEVDAFPILHDFHSRWDKAHYYISLADDKSRYVAADFFNWNNENRLVDLILCFYPFVSTAPALAWGLPSHFASPEKWLTSFELLLKPGGYVLVIHQGKWEEEDFDLTREKLKSPLQLCKRDLLESSFFSTAHPMCASLYQKPLS